MNPTTSYGLLSSFDQSAAPFLLPGDELLSNDPRSASSHSTTVNAAASGVGTRQSSLQQPIDYSDWLNSTASTPIASDSGLALSSFQATTTPSASNPNLKRATTTTTTTTAAATASSSNSTTAGTGNASLIGDKAPLALTSDHIVPSNTQFVNEHPLRSSRRLEAAAHQQQHHQQVDPLTTGNLAASSPASAFAPATDLANDLFLRTVTFPVHPLQHQSQQSRRQASAGTTATSQQSFVTPDPAPILAHQSATTRSRSPQRQVTAATVVPPLSSTSLAPNKKATESASAPAPSPPMTRQASRSSPSRAAAEAASAAISANSSSATPNKQATAPVETSSSSASTNIRAQASALPTFPEVPSTSTRSRRSLGAVHSDYPPPVAASATQVARSTSMRTTRSKNGALPPFQESEVPQEPDAEAALHLLRLAQPDAIDAATGEISPVDDDAEGESDGSSARSLGDSTVSSSTKATTVGGSAPPPTKRGGRLASSSQANTRRGSRLSNESSQSTSSPAIGVGSMLSAIDRFEDHSVAREWHFSDDAQQPPLRLPLSLSEFPSRAPSVASSTASAGRNARSHRPARIQREAAAAAAAAAALRDEASPSTRRTSGRARKPVLSAPEVASEDDDDDDTKSAYEDDGGEASAANREASDSEEDPAFSAKRKGKGKASVKGRGRGRPSKRGSDIGTSSLNPTPAKKIRTSTSPYAHSVRADTPGSTISTSSTRRARRQPVIPTNLTERAFPPDIEKDNAQFPRFYRSFPISSAFPPDSFVHRGTGLPTPTSASSGITAAAELANSARVPDLTLPPLPSTSNAMDVDDPFAARGNAIAGPSSSTAVSPTFQTTRTPPSTTLSFLDVPEGAKWNKGADPFNIYMPRFVRGTADSKEGMCPVCIEPVARGGEGEERWLKLKNSSFVYHMSYAHGLSNLTGLPFSPPTRLRQRPTGATTKDARDEMTDGLCHKCNEWIPLLSVKRIETVVPELIWWKHAKKCHGETAIAGEGDYYIRDPLYDFVSAKKAQHGM